MKKLKEEILKINLGIAKAVEEGKFGEASNLRLLLNIKIDKLIKRKRQIDYALEKLNMRIDAKSE